MSRLVKIRYFLSKIVKIRAKSPKKWLQVRCEPTPHFLPLCTSPCLFSLYSWESESSRVLEMAWILLSIWHFINFCNIYWTTKINYRTQAHTKCPNSSWWSVQKRTSKRDLCIFKTLVSIAFSLYFKTDLHCCGLCKGALQLSSSELHSGFTFKNDLASFW